MTDLDPDMLRRALLVAIAIFAFISALEVEENDD